MHAVAPQLRFREVGKAFTRSVTALDAVSLDVNAGEFVTVVGPSGCGKSTLLRLAAGLTTPSTGTIVAPPTDELGYMFQEPALLPWRNVRGNVELLAQLRGLPGERRRRLTADTIELVGLGGFERHYPLQLSVGMRMRVSLARSLTLEPTTFLFDEPFGALDEITRERLNDELLKLYVSRRFAALLVTHSVSEAVFLGSRVVVLSARPGRVVQEFSVPFGYPRSSDLRHDSVFTEVVAEAKDALRAGSG